MLLSAIRDEFVFHCQTRKLSPRTIKNYGKQIDYLLRFLEREHGISVIEDVSPRHIKEFLHNMLKAGRTTNYVNDLLKAFKVFFRYAFEEEYINFSPSLTSSSISFLTSSVVISFPPQIISLSVLWSSVQS